MFLPTQLFVALALFAALALAKPEAEAQSFGRVNLELIN